MLLNRKSDRNPDMNTDRNENRNRDRDRDRDKLEIGIGIGIGMRIRMFLLNKADYRALQNYSISRRELHHKHILLILDILVKLKF